MELSERYRQKLEYYLRLQSPPDLAAAIEDVREEITGLGAQIDEELLSAVADAIRNDVEHRVKRIRDPYTLHSRRAKWYEGGEPDDLHWPSLQEYLLVKKGWDQDTVESISHSSRHVVSELSNPGLDTFRTRGMVVGYVQSGKTANMTAVMARAADAGYNFMIVMAGMTDNLRDQTQKRLAQDLYERAPNNWDFLTGTNIQAQDGTLLESGEYRGQPGRKFPMLAKDVVRLAVIKKNSAPLEKLIDDIRRTSAPIRNRLRVLVIDDEADQASPNAGRTDEDPTTTNIHVRNLLASLPAVSYVGYTATPFANILINPWPTGVTDEDGELLDDLYPRDFLVSLPRPDAYFGPERIFGRDPADAEDEGCDGLDIIRDISEQEVSVLSPATRDLDNFTAKMVPSLDGALSWFLLTVAARLCRGQHDKHMSMLVHTSHRVLVHEATQKLIEQWIHETRKELSTSAMLARLRKLWDDEIEVIPEEEFFPEKLKFDDIGPFLKDAADQLEIAVENSPSEARLSYSGEPKAWIAIGGNILARGITLEGLVVTYFIRGSKQYDTLLQMGRWFGFRHGYEDLVRLWMPSKVQRRYRQLALVEYDLRQEIEEYALREATPLDFSARIRTLPGLQVTAPNKMRSARTADIDFFGTHLQTIRFPRLDRNILKANWESAGQLLKDAGITDRSNIVTGVSKETVTTFLQAFKVDESHRELSSSWVEDFINKNPKALKEWSVALVQPSRRGKSVQVSQVPLGTIESPSLVNRSRLKDDNEDGRANIKALMSRRDVLLDLEDSMLPSEPGWSKWDWASLKKWREGKVGKRPLLLIYPIDQNSQPKDRLKPDNSSKRTGLDAVHHIIGIGIVFPEMNPHERRNRAVTYINVPLPERDIGESDEPEDGDE